MSMNVLKRRDIFLTDLLKKLACGKMKGFIGAKKPATIQTVFTIFIDS